ncbi:glycosyltransferase [Pseudoalteromonas sp. SG44-8]|uniref:CgeB family protein n=1 Tax=Pseudoalteromonas sp. SG44-8 TaxID=2760958 RepID=UPI001604882C|nr:glycosyltransferase [Pseudoalteromonas sp. SG44-8]MBB1399444.1 glycosyltransferase [Pseudoalteromonas sp. SG44-8]
MESIKISFYNLVNSLKSKFKTIEFFYNINAVFKEWVLHRDYRNLSLRYNLNPSKNSSELSSGFKDKAFKTNIRGDRLKVIWIGACYEQDYSGFIQALNKVADVIVFTKNDGTYGQQVPNIRRGLIFDNERRINGERLLSIFNDSGGAKEVDLVIGQMWSNLMDPSVLMDIRNKGSMVVNIAMDDKLPVHWKEDKYGRLSGAIGLANSVDLTLNTYKQAVSMYAKHGADCIYWPLASNQDVFKPENEKVYDVVFIGSNYGYRAKLINKLQKAGINIKAFGPGFESGMISAQESAEIFGKSKIILGIGYISYSRKLATLKLRDFDALFTGALYITTRNPDLEDILIENEHIVYYDSINELIEKIEYYLKNESVRLDVAERALKLANENHTWDIRIADTIDILGLTDDR